MYDFSPIISRKLIWYKPLQEYTTSDTSFSTFLPNLWKTVIFIGTKKWQTYTTIVVHQQQNNLIFPRDGIMCSHSQENNSASFYRRISFLSFTLLLTKNLPRCRHHISRRLVLTVNSSAARSKVFVGSESDGSRSPSIFGVALGAG